MLSLQTAASAFYKRDPEKMASPYDNATISIPTSNSTKREELQLNYRAILIAIYILVLVIGSVGLILMINILKSNMRSMTTIAVLNLIVAHLIFLLTVPFRIYYYFHNKWVLTKGLCKVVSAMIHLHMYMTFVIYVVILTIRILTFYKRAERLVFYRKLHALGASAAMWSVTLIAVPIVLMYKYGKTKDTDQNKCFHFGDMLRKDSGIATLNYIISAIFIIVACVLSCIQGHILWDLVRKYGSASSAQQEFWAQMKSLCFVLVMLICFVPYHVFRIHYLGNPDLHWQNEVFLAMTALSCFDMLTFLGRGVRHACGRRMV